jgi:hypothetical protein
MDVNRRAALCASPRKSSIHMRTLVLELEGDMTLAVLLVAAFILMLYLWTPRTRNGIILYCVLVLGFGLITLIVRHFSSK